MVHITQDLRYLYKLDSYDELPEEAEGLQEAWSKIYQKWGDVIGGKKASLSFLKQKQQAARKYNYNFDLTIYRMVQRLPLPEIVERFNALGYSVDLENYESSMKSAYGKIAKKRAHIEINEPKENDSIDFDALITTLEKEQGYGFDEQKMTVRKLATIYKQVNGRRKDQKTGHNRRSGNNNRSSKG